MKSCLLSNQPTMSNLFFTLSLSICCNGQPNDENTNILYHPPEYDGPILFSFREKVFFGKKKAAIRVDTGEWSEKFSLDVAGSSGVIACQANNMTYQVSPSIEGLILGDSTISLLISDWRSQHIDAQLADQADRVYAVLYSDQPG